MALSLRGNRFIYRFTPMFIPMLPRVVVLSALLLLGFGNSARLWAAGNEDPLRTPVNQVFQFMQSGTCSAWPDKSTSKATGYLWIPENCSKVRGLVIMCTNVPEHMLVGHPAIRRACEDNSLGLVWFVPSFWNFSGISKGLEKTQVGFLQQMLDGLAKVSGYDEVATVPWLPMGESGHLLMVTGVVDQRPEHCIAAVCIKNPQYLKDRTVPMLWTLGTAQEWGQTKGDIRNANHSIAGSYTSWSRGRGTWPLSLAIESGTGHFYCTDQMAQLFGKYIDSACKARLSDDGSPTLKPLDLEKGVLAHLPMPGYEDQQVIPYAQAAPADRGKPWFFDEATARQAQVVSQANWNAACQLPSLANGVNCTIDPFSFNSVTAINVTTDGEFSMTPVLLDKIPKGFVGEGEKLEQSPGRPIVEWICGTVAPSGNGKFRVALDRTWKSCACYMVVRKEASENVRCGVQPIAVRLTENKEGAPQVLTFGKIPDVRVGTPSIPLVATSSARLPVEFYVVAGPAIVQQGRLVFTKIPPRTRFPVSVTVAAWQWGKCKAPKVQMAGPVMQTFQILR